MRELPFYTNWSYAHPRAIELAAELASLAPGDLNRVFFVSGGSEAVESAWKLARQYYVARHQARLKAIAVTLPGAEPETRHDAIVSEMRRPPNRYKAIARHLAYHGTTMGALSINGIPALRSPFEPLVPDVRARAQHEPLPPPARRRPRRSSPRSCSTTSSRRSSRWGRSRSAWCTWSRCRTRAARSSPPAGYWQGVRALCDQYEILLSRRRGDHRLRAARPLVRAPSATTSGPTSSRARRASRRRTRRSAPSSPPTA